MLSEEEKKAIEILDTFELRRKTINYKNISLEDVQSVKIVLKLIEKQQKEIEKYKRYFKLAISDLQSEGYMQMPFKNIENYYSKREDIV